MISLDVNLTPILAQFDNMHTQVQQALRPAVYQAAHLVYAEAQKRAPVSDVGGHWFYSRRNSNGEVGQKYWFTSGSLRQSIYIKHAPEQSAQGQCETYVISWRKKSSQLGYVPYAHMVEYGTAHQAPRPFVRPAYDAKRAQAEQLIIDAITQAITS